MRICMISEASTYHTQRWVSGLINKGCDLHLISSQNANIAGCHLHVLKLYHKNPIKQILAIIKVRLLLWMLNPDVVHLFGLFAINSFGSKFIAYKVKRLAITLWGSDIIPGGDKETLQEKRIKRFLLGQATRFMAASSYLASRTQEYCRRTERIDIIPWGVSINTFCLNNTKTANNQFTIGFAKRLHMLAGPDVMIKVFHIVKQKIQSPVRLRIAGDGPMKEQLLDLVKNLEIDKDIEWCGWLTNEKELVSFYHSLDLFVMPSIRESFGVSAIEAAACGVPCVASAIGGIPEVIVDKETGVLVSSEDCLAFADAIINLINDPALLKKMGKAARVRAESLFDWNSTLEKTLTVYKEMYAAEKAK